MDAGPGKGDLLAKVRDWIEKQGYPLEMRAAKVFLDAGFSVIQSESYPDPETGKPREIDLSSLMFDVRQTYSTVLSFAVECKSTKAKPWIVLCSTGEDSSIFSMAYHAASKPGRSVLWSLTWNSAAPALSIFQLSKRKGYGITAAFKERQMDQDAAFAACHSCTNAAAALVRSREGFAVPGYPSCHVVLPLVVVDGPLFECYLDHSGEIAIAPVEESTLLWRNVVQREYPLSPSAC